MKVKSIFDRYKVPTVDDKCFGPIRQIYEEDVIEEAKAFSQ